MQRVLERLGVWETHSQGRRVDGAAKAVLFSVHDLNVAAGSGTHALVLGPQGHRAGPVLEVMDAATLGEVFGHALQRVHAGGQWLFVPA